MNWNGCHIFTDIRIFGYIVPKGSNRFYIIFTDWCVMGLYFEYLCIYTAMEKTSPWRPVTKNALVPFQFLVTELLVFVVKVEFLFNNVFSYVCAGKHHPYMWQYHSFVSAQYGCATPAQNFELVLWLKISHLWWDCCYPLPHIEIVRVTQWKPLTQKKLISIFDQM